MADKWAAWLHNPCRLVHPQCFRAGGEVRSGPASGPRGYIAPVVWGVPDASQWGTKSEVAQGWGGWLHNPCCLVHLPRFRAGHKIRKGPQVGQEGPQVGRVATYPLPFGRFPTHKSGGQNPKCPTSGPGGYITPSAWRIPNASAWRIPNASERGTKSQVGHNSAWWLHNPCRLAGPQRFSAEEKIRSALQVGLVAA